MAQDIKSRACSLLGPSREIDSVYIEELKILCYALGVPRRALENKSELNELVSCVWDSLGDDEEAITFTYHALKELGVCIKGLEKHLQPGYDLRKKYPEVDYRLTVIGLVNDLGSEDDYKILRDFVCSVLRVSYGRIKNRTTLIDYIFSEGTHHIADLTFIYEVATSFNRESIFVEYCNRHNLRVPQANADAQAVPGPQYLLEMYNRWIAEKRPRRFCTCKQKACFSIMIVMLVAVALAGTGVTIKLALHSENNKGSVNVTDYSLVNINPDGFMDDLHHIELTLITQDENVEVNVYKEPCNSVKQSMNKLQPSHIAQLYTPYFKRQPYNYRGEDNPLYGLEGSFLRFNLSANSTNSDPGCLKISVFNRHNYYYDATNPGEDNTTRVDGVIDHSPCLSVSISGPPANSSWTFTFDRPQYVYTTVDEGKRVQIDGIISGHLVKYSIPSGDPVCQLLTTTQSPAALHKCKVDVCGKRCAKSGSPTQCLFVRIQPTENLFFQQIEIMYETVSSIHINRNFYYSLCSFFFVSLVIGLLIIIVIIKLCLCPCGGVRICLLPLRRETVLNYIRQSSDTPLLEGSGHEPNATCQ